MAPVNEAADTASPFLETLPEEVARIAAPYQNLSAVMLLPQDGCYWYQHVGPVETTMLPLRSLRGRAICTETKDRPATSVSNESAAVAPVIMPHG